MGSRPIRIVIEGYVDKGLAIDLANAGGIFFADPTNTNVYMEAIGWLGAMAQEESDLTFTVSCVDL